MRTKENVVIYLCSLWDQLESESVYLVQSIICKR